MMPRTITAVLVTLTVLLPGAALALERERGAALKALQELRTAELELARQKQNLAEHEECAKSHPKIGQRNVCRRRLPALRSDIVARTKRRDETARRAEAARARLETELVRMSRLQQQARETAKAIRVAPGHPANKRRALETIERDRRRLEVYMKRDGALEALSLLRGLREGLEIGRPHALLEQQIMAWVGKRPEWRPIAQPLVRITRNIARERLAGKRLAMFDGHFGNALSVLQFIEGVRTPPSNPFRVAQVEKVRHAVSLLANTTSGNPGVYFVRVFYLGLALELIGEIESSFEAWCKAEAASNLQRLVWLADRPNELKAQSAWSGLVEACPFGRIEMVDWALRYEHRGPFAHVIRTHGVGLYATVPDSYRDNAWLWVAHEDQPAPGSVREAVAVHTKERRSDTGLSSAPFRGLAFYPQRTGTYVARLYRVRDSAEVVKTVSFEVAPSGWRLFVRPIVAKPEQELSVTFVPASGTYEDRFAAYVVPADAPHGDEDQASDVSTDDFAYRMSRHRPNRFILEAPGEPGSYEARAYVRDREVAVARFRVGKGTDGPRVARELFDATKYSGETVTWKTLDFDSKPTRTVLRSEELDGFRISHLDGRLMTLVNPADLSSLAIAGGNVNSGPNGLSASIGYDGDQVVFDDAVRDAFRFELTAAGPGGGCVDRERRRGERRSKPDRGRDVRRGRHRRRERGLHAGPPRSDREWREQPLLLRCAVPCADHADRSGERRPRRRRDLRRRRLVRPAEVLIQLRTSMRVRMTTSAGRAPASSFESSMPSSLRRRPSSRTAKTGWPEGRGWDIGASVGWLRRTLKRPSVQPSTS